MGNVPSAELSELNRSEWKSPTWFRLHENTRDEDKIAIYFLAGFLRLEPGAPEGKLRIFEKPIQGRA